MKTHAIISFKNPLGKTIEIVKQTFSACGEKPGKRISFVGGLHGNELEGVYLCSLLINTLRKLEDSRPEAFKGEINIYPAVNPQAVDAGTRLSPFFFTDMNRLMAEDASGNSLPAKSAQALLNDLKASSDLVVDFHASNLHLKELPQIRIIEGFEKKLIPLANDCNVDLIWVHPKAKVFESTLGYNLNRSKIPALVVETGISLRINKEYCDQILQGMIHLLCRTKILVLSEPPPQVKQPVLLKSSQVVLAQASQPGLFVSRMTLGQSVRKGDVIGEVVDPVGGTVLEKIAAAEDGFLFTLREHPLTYPGAPVARIALAERDRR